MDMGNIADAARLRRLSRLCEGQALLLPWRSRDRVDERFGAVLGNVRVRPEGYIVEASPPRVRSHDTVADARTVVLARHRDTVLPVGEFTRLQEEKAGESDKLLLILSREMGG